MLSVNNKEKIVMKIFRCKGVYIFLMVLIALVISHKNSNAQPARKFTNSYGMEFIYISPGDFMMGSPLNELERKKDEVLHPVTLKKGFYMQTTEVTQKQWKMLMGENPSRFNHCGDNCPVEQVSWNDVQKFIRELNQKEKTDKYRLPTEAEWEYACRAGTKTPFSFGKCLSSSQANNSIADSLPECPKKGEYRATPVATANFPPNAWGLYDMHGNVFEWCRDWYEMAYSSDRVTDPPGPSEQVRIGVKVRRGGGWNSTDRDCRSASRNYASPDSYSSNIGFRLIKISD